MEVSWKTWPLVFWQLKYHDFSYLCTLARPSVITYLLSPIVTLFHQKKTSIQMFYFMILDFICFLNFPMNLCSLQLDTKFMWITSLSPSIVFMVLIHSLSCHSLLSEFQTHLSFVLLLYYITKLWSWVI